MKLPGLALPFTILANVLAFEQPKANSGLRNACWSSFTLLERMPRLHHYQTKSLEEYLERVSGNFSWLASGNKNRNLNQTWHLEEAMKSFHSRNGDECYDDSILHCASSDCLEPVPVGIDKLAEHCLDLYGSDGVTDCRPHFLTLLVRHVDGEDKYFPEFVNFHLRQGVDFVLIWDMANSIKFRQLMQPWVDKGYAEVVLHEVKDAFAPLVTVVTELLTEKKTFWLLHIDVDEFVFLANCGSLRDVLLPITSLRTTLPKEIHMSSRRFGSNGLNNHPAKYNCAVESPYLRRYDQLEANGKSMVLLDALSEESIKVWNGHSHRFALDSAFDPVEKFKSRYKARFGFFLFGTFFIWSQLDAEFVLRVGAVRECELLALTTVQSILVVATSAAIWALYKRGRLCRRLLPSNDA